MGDCGERERQGEAVREKWKEGKRAGQKQTTKKRVNRKKLSEKEETGKIDVETARGLSRKSGMWRNGILPLLLSSYTFLNSMH